MEEGRETHTLFGRLTHSRIKRPAALACARDELLANVRDGILPFWRTRAIDSEYGGYFTNFDGNGQLAIGPHDKLIVTQTRLIWAFTTLASLADDAESVLDLARHGVDFLAERFLDGECGGWRWRVSRTGEPLDEAKLMYGQAFALYALSVFARASGEHRAKRLAEETFDVIHRAADVARGGFYENLERGWRLARGGSAAGDRKSLDTHLHLLEAFTELVRLTGDAAHVRQLRDVRELVCGRMLDAATGAGGNQYSFDFTPQTPIAIDRTWIAERPSCEPLPPAPVNLTSYGHNLELAWLLREADVVLGAPRASDAIIASLTRHALAHGYDRVHGGVYREGPADGAATDREKEFWQNAEALVGFLEGYRVTKDDDFLEAFLGTWEFARKNLVHSAYGEWRVRVSENGEIIDGDLANNWKNAYHTGRAAFESVRRLDTLNESLAASRAL